MSAIDDMVWPSPDFSRVPYTVFGDQDVFDREMDRIFHGPVWCYLGLEAEMPEPSDYLTTFIGDRSVVVNRAEDGTLHGFINRCAHRGSTIVRDTHGSATEHVCIYHHWTYDLKGNLIGVPFERGVAGHGGMPQSFRKEDHGLTMIRVESYKGAIFGSVHSDVEPLYDYLDAPIRDYLDRFLAKPIEILGYMRQRMPSNWKLYWENVNDHYHGGLLHQFSTTFGFFRPTQESKTVFDKYGRQWVAYSVYGQDEAETISHEYEGIGVYDESLQLEDPSVTEFRDEVGDGQGLILLTVFPGVLFQRIANTLATRHLRPKGPDEFELYWTYFGYRDDDAELRAMRLKQANLVGPAGLISMEDGESGVEIQRAIGRERRAHSVIEMGGLGAIEETDHSVTELPLRGFWRYYAHFMGFHVEGNEAPWSPTS